MAPRSRPGRQSVKVEIKNFRRYISNHGLLQQLEETSDTDLLPTGHNKDMVQLLRAGIDQAILDVLNSASDIDRKESLEWFCTSAFDHICEHAGLDVGYTFSIMQKVFDKFKESRYGKDWKKPNVLERVSVSVA